MLNLGTSPKVMPELKLPLKPSLLFLCSTMFIIPDIPSGLYLALGFVISSIFLIDVAGICFRSCAGSMFVGLPSTNTLTFEFPRSEILPSWSTFTDGMLFMISDAVPPAVVRSRPTLITLRSIFCSTVVSSLTISISSRVVASSVSVIVPKLAVLEFSLRAAVPVYVL